MLGGAGPGLAQDKPGPALVAELCTKCHGLDELVGMAQDREGWADTVYSMIARGAPIYPEEIDVIIDYLSNAYPPESR
jgi:hypothetical protein